MKYAYLKEKITKKKKLYITGGFEGQTIIEIPEQIHGDTVEGIADYAFRDRMDIVEVVIPAGVNHIGGHAFYNCKKLERLELHDGIKDLEDGAFKNCYKLTRVYMHCHNNREGCIRNLMSDNIQELTLDIEYDNEEKSTLTFPTFEDDYVENTPARIFQSVCYGTGGAYRQCMQSGTMDYREFDRLFPRSTREDRFEAALWNAVGRLKYPYKLYSSAKAEYACFLRDNDYRAAAVLMDNDRIDGINIMCEHQSIGRESIDGLIEYAQGLGRVDYLGILVNYRNQYYPAGKRSFDL